MNKDLSIFIPNDTKLSYNMHNFTVSIVLFRSLLKKNKKRDTLIFRMKQVYMYLSTRSKIRMLLIIFKRRKTKNISSAGKINLSYTI